MNRLQPGSPPFITTLLLVVTITSTFTTQTQIDSTLANDTNLATNTATASIPPLPPPSDPSELERAVELFYNKPPPPSATHSESSPSIDQILNDMGDEQSQMLHLPPIVLTQTATAPTRMSHVHQMTNV